MFSHLLYDQNEVCCVCEIYHTSLACLTATYIWTGVMVDPNDFGDASGLPILMDDVKCTGSESNVLSCPQLQLNVSHDCTHQEDVAISCTGLILSHTPHSPHSSHPHSLAYFPHTTPFSLTLTPSHLHSAPLPHSHPHTPIQHPFSLTYICCSGCH